MVPGATANVSDTLYFSDVWFRDRGERAVVEECREAVESGYLGVRIKAGRGDRWMQRKGGDDRDIAVVRAVREAIGAGKNIPRQWPTILAFEGRWRKPA